MKDTVKAKNGYVVKHSKKDKKTAYVFDGENVLMKAEVRSYEDYKDEVIEENNEAAHQCEVFTTVKNNQFIYWRDEETDEDFITKTR